MLARRLQEWHCRFYKLANTSCSRQTTLENYDIERLHDGLRGVPFSDTPCIVFAAVVVDHQDIVQWRVLPINRTRHEETERST